MAVGSAEEAVLRAVMEEDFDEARERLEDFFPSELDDLAGHLETLADMIADVRRGKSAR